MLAVSGSSVFALSPDGDESDSTRVILRSKADALAENLKTLKQLVPQTLELNDSVWPFYPEVPPELRDLKALKDIPGMPRHSANMPVVRPRDHFPMHIHVPDSSVHYTLLIK